MEMKFTWDATKNESNQRGHGISFEMAREVFADPFMISTENYYFPEEGEQRYVAMGMTRKLQLLVVVFVEQSDADTEVIHIISARKAVAYEQRIYEAQIS